MSDIQQRAGGLNGAQQTSRISLSLNTQNDFTSIWLQQSVPTFFSLFTRKSPDLLLASDFFWGLVTLVGTFIYKYHFIYIILESLYRRKLSKF